MLWTVGTRDWREPSLAPYRVPTVDVLDDDSDVLVLPPEKAQILSVQTGQISWLPVSGATFYEVERRSAGTLYEVIATVTAPATSLTHAGIVGPALFRVRAGNQGGKGVPSHPAWLPAS